MSESDEDGLQDALSYTQAIVDTVREPLPVLDPQLRVTTASRAFYQIFAVLCEGTLQQFIHDVGEGQWDIPGLVFFSKKFSHSTNPFRISK